ncbi:translocation protein Sec62-domain-containing protein [Cantharellus anzutake]|uniref:translocation protein Sec62-domain-containing protein n=1 Tax=Cantharellus anzutake TaxID=1750568 RepID=UPI0019057592|nr:translocation protein Sec62-domain-containing protein [Cantharellus anzutake]KAF8342558.1 translocation protein Sec62-domain-containing protein [Cantharellus anzutake]
MEQQATAPPDIVKLVQWLRSSSSGIKTKTGILNGSRLDYFKGKAAVKAIMSPAYAKLKGAPPQPKTEEEANALLLSAIPFAFFLRVERGPPSGSSSSSPKQLQIVQQQTFQPDLYFAWFYQGSQWTTYLGGALMVALILGGVMFPLWPPIMRLGAYYLSLAFFGLIGLFMALSVFRLFFYIITIFVASPGIWIFPKLFADVGFVESFIPAWDWDLPPKKKGKKKKLGSDKKSKREPKSQNGSAESSSDALAAGISTAIPVSSTRSRIAEVADEGND